MAEMDHHFSGGSCSLLETRLTTPASRTLSA